MPTTTANLEKGTITPASARDPRYIDLEQLFTRRNGTYVLRAKGDGFASANICDGDLLVIERTTKAKIGAMVLELIKGGAVIRERTALADTEPSSIVGVVLGVMRGGK